MSTTEHERRVKLTINILVWVICSRYVFRLMRIPPDIPNRLKGLFSSSAQLVHEKDTSLNKDELIAFIEQDTKTFLSGLNKHFEDL